MGSNFDAVTLGLTLSFVFAWAVLIVFGRKR